jgi:hypothetical protein
MGNQNTKGEIPLRATEQDLVSGEEEAREEEEEEEDREEVVQSVLLTCSFTCSLSPRTALGPPREREME